MPVQAWLYSQAVLRGQGGEKKQLQISSSTAEVVGDCKAMQAAALAAVIQGSPQAGAAASEGLLCKCTQAPGTPRWCSARVSSAGFGLRRSWAGRSDAGGCTPQGRCMHPTRPVAVQDVGPPARRRLLPG